jgi:predicted transcriptional regulator
MNLRTVTIDIADRKQIAERAKAATRGQRVGAFVSFASPEDLWRTLTPNRWAMLKAMTGKGALGIRALARILKRDVKGVHTDSQTLVHCGLLDKTEDGKVEFPYDAIHVDFTITHAA